MYNFISPYVLISNKFLRSFKKQTSFFLSIFFFIFRIASFFLEIRKKNKRNFKLCLEKIDELYSVFFTKSLTNNIKGAEFSFFIRNEKEIGISISNGDNFGNETDISTSYTDKYSRMTSFNWKNFYTGNGLNFLVVKAREVFISFKIIGFFFCKFFLKEKKDLKVNFFKQTKIEIFKNNNSLKNNICDLILRENRNRFSLFDLIFEIFEEKIQIKGIFTKKQTNWLKFDLYQQKISLFNWKIKNFAKRILYLDKIFLSERNFFFLYHIFSFFNNKSFIKWKNFLEWNSISIQNIFNELSNFSQFFLNFFKTEALSDFKKKNSSDINLFLNRLVFIENFQTNYKIIHLKKKILFWTKKNIFLFKKYKIFYHVSSNILFFFFQTCKFIFVESSIYSEYIFSKKNCDMKSHENLNKKKKPKYMIFKKKKLFQSSPKILQSGQSENYFDFK
ncbi:hypothetical protein CMESO_530 (nucleomorph) [Chroomonas mesostigmatica CCMP1168]|uniref:Uncharacterized protein n=1 Tax=Chroomonas mesostigmatica CCMP1168 TaxID=1195612 RepID=J7G3N2_9CRYP|nr:hypothetical protein CMESO_530 [Chroomonas mesostigmatica CCMP1168]